MDYFEFMKKIDETLFEIKEHENFLEIKKTIETLKVENRGYGLDAIIANGKLKKFITLSKYELLKIKINV